MTGVAIATYIDNDKNLIEEFGWLYKSWQDSGAYRTSEIVAFYNPQAGEFIPKDVIGIPLVPLSETAEWKDYKFINSVWFLTTPEASVLSRYGHVLRTDNDCFLTPHFKNFRPRLATFGAGMYATEPIVMAKLAMIAAKWGLKTPFNNVGSTIMAKPGDVLQYSQVQLEFCKKLRDEEFTEGYGTWPGWFFGVLTMYAGQLAASAVFGHNMAMGGFDVHCMSQDEMCSTDYHIHAFHTYDHFSKFKWRAGDYDGHEVKNPKIISDYCLSIARGAR